MAKKLTQTHWVLIGLGLVLLLSIFWFIGTYNSLVRLDEDVNNKWSQVETVYQRRIDLIPNLVESVKGFTEQEQAIFIGVTEARTQWLDASTVDQKAAAATEMSSALARLLVTVEAYPNIKSNENFLALQDELANTENKISVERKRYNDAVTQLNRKTRFFPANIVAGMMGFEERTYFEAAEGAEAAPAVSFT